jgi:hypothetical protein
MLEKARDWALNPVAADTRSDPPAAVLSQLLFNQTRQYPICTNARLRNSVYIVGFVLDTAARALLQYIGKMGDLIM